MPVVIAQQLALKGIDVVTVRDIGQLGDSDINHLQRATEMERVLCTQLNIYELVPLRFKRFQKSFVFLRLFVVKDFTFSLKTLIHQKMSNQSHLANFPNPA